MDSVMRFGIAPLMSVFREWSRKDLSPQPLWHKFLHYTHYAKALIWKFNLNILLSYMKYLAISTNMLVFSVYMNIT